MERNIVLYTRREGIVNKVRERLAGTDIAVIVDTTDRGRFRDPSFVDHRGRAFVGYEPLIAYLDAVRQGQDDPDIENPLGQVLAAIKALPQRSAALDDPYLVGDFFRSEVVDARPYLPDLHTRLN
ncbi:hypothetical protein HYW21_07425 [Candidatus Woesearchaeota archaeon]|nr:hypothetical protein [Candidatus Woesearchaeota archaeon]